MLSNSFFSHFQVYLVYSCKAKSDLCSLHKIIVRKKCRSTTHNFVHRERNNRETEIQSWTTCIVSNEILWYSCVCVLRVFCSYICNMYGTCCMCCFNERDKSVVVSNINNIFMIVILSQFNLEFILFLNLDLFKNTHFRSLGEANFQRASIWLLFEWRSSTRLFSLFSFSSIHSSLCSFFIFLPPSFTHIHTLSIPFVAFLPL